MKIAEGKIAVFAGTTEGRVLASRLAGSQVAADVFVATEYGKEEIPKAENLQVHDGRVDEIQMEKLFQEKKYDLILDATHPFAVLHLPSSLEVTNFAHGQAQLIKYEIPEGRKEAL